MLLCFSGSWGQRKHAPETHVCFWVLGSAVSGDFCIYKKQKKGQKTAWQIQEETGAGRRMPSNSTALWRRQTSVPHDKMQPLHLFNSAKSVGVGSKKQTSAKMVARFPHYYQETCLSGLFPSPQQRFWASQHLTISLEHKLEGWTTSLMCCHQPKLTC